MTTFGARLRSARLAKGYTQDDLADLLGVTKSAVSAWENDRETPAFDKLEPLHRVLGVSIDGLLFGEAAAGAVAEPKMAWPVPPPRDQARTPEERSMLRVFRGMEDRQRRGLLAAFSGGSAARQASQDMQPADLSMAIQLANEKIAAAGLAPTPEEYGALVLHLHDLLADGLATADLYDIRSGRLANSSTGDDGNDSPASQATGQGQRTAQPAAQHGGKARRKP